MTTGAGAWLKIGGATFSVRDDNPGGNLYPHRHNGTSYSHSVVADHGDTIELFGNRYEVNLMCGGTSKVCELVLLCEPGDPEGEPGHIDPGPAPCTACNAASLIESALEILSPDDCTISNVCRGDCGTVTFDVLSDDCGPYRCRVTVEILEA
jgi:hypothetical protein